MTDGEVEMEGFARRYVRGPRFGYEYLVRSNEQAGEMARRVGRRRAYEIAGLEGCALPLEEAA